ncbi:MAG: hypothetical protein L3K09_04405 [Thermoplasmata archaeon]|nr:hypothetical protein [Thermoplasmata archaeon]
MVEDSELEMNLLEFELKSFAFERQVSLEGLEVVVFSRTETVSEAKLRPNLVHLRVAVPREWLIYDLSADALRIARDGGTGGPRATGSALEAAAGKTEFREQGVDWRRTVLPSGSYLYVPVEFADRLLSAPGLSALATA